MINFKVSELLNYLKETTNKDFILNNLVVEGEVSNLKLHSGGSAYLTIKDEYSKLSCIMYNYSKNDKIKSIVHGDQVEVKGKLTISESDGSLKLIIDEIENVGLGKSYEKFLLVKKILEEEGYFDSDHKKTIPEFSNSIGIITSSNGAAIKDIISVTKRRNPYINLYLYPASVQGPNSVESLISGLKFFESFNVDLVIIGRGGGSYEDLDSFNSIELAREIYNFPIPIISAVGHEIDFVISDFVADLRAATPSAAAEIAAKDTSILDEQINNYIKKAEKLLLDKVNQFENSLESIYKNIMALSIDKQLEQKSFYLDALFQKFNYNLSSYLNIKNNELLQIGKSINYQKYLNTIEKENSNIKYLLDKAYKELDYKYLSNERHLLLLKNRMDKLDVKSIQKNGYSLLFDENSKLIKSINEINENQLFSLLLEDGEVKVKALEKKVY